MPVRRREETDSSKVPAGGCGTAGPHPSACNEWELASRGEDSRLESPGIPAQSRKRRRRRGPATGSAGSGPRSQLSMMSSHGVKRYRRRTSRGSVTGLLVDQNSDSALSAGRVGLLARRRILWLGLNLEDTKCVVCVSNSSRNKGITKLRTLEIVLAGTKRPHILVTQLMDSCCKFQLPQPRGSVTTHETGCAKIALPCPH
jgi:hypothetical protein